MIRSFEGAEISVRNGDLLSKEVVNWTGEVLRSELRLGVACGTDPEPVLEIPRRMAAKRPQVLDEPEVKECRGGFGESALEFRLRSLADVEEWIDVVSDLRTPVVRELHAAGLSIPFPRATCPCARAWAGRL